MSVQTEINRINTAVTEQDDLIYQIKVSLGLIRTLKAVFSENSWDDIIWACQNNAVPDTWVADGTCSKTMTIDGNDYVIDIIGKNHDSYADGSGTAPLTFQMHDCYKMNYFMNSSPTNVGGYSGAEMHTTHLPTIKALMPSDVQEAIKPVSKLTSGGSASSIIENVSCELFLLSEIEIFGNVSNSVSGEGSQYAYYSENNSKIKNFDGAATWWWERSPYYNNSGWFCCVDSGGSSGVLNANYDYGVAPAFCF